MSGYAGVLAVLLESAVKGSIMVGAAALLCALVRRGNPSLRGLLWFCAIASYPVFAVLAILPLSLPSLEGPLGNLETTFAAASASAAPSGSTGPAGAMAAPSGARSWIWLPVAIWLAGALMGWAQLLRATLLVRFRLASAREAHDVRAAGRAGRAVRLLAAPDCSVPFTVGLLRPIVVLPARLLEGPVSDFRPILAHELEHVRRMDCLTRRLARCVSCLYWFLPLPWLALKRMNEEQERACDEAVIGSGVAPEDYACTLVQAMRSSPPACAPGLGAPTRSLERRVRNVLTLPHRRSSSMTRTHRTLSVLAAVLLAPLALVRCADAAPEPRDTAAAPSPKAAAAMPALAWPLVGDAGRVTAKFGTLPNPLSPGTWYFHKGVDIAWTPGAPVVAAAAGTVMCAEDDPASDYGCMVEIDHGAGYHTLYAHLEQVQTAPGETVQRGQRIGSVGNTGKSLGYHLHFELILDGQPVDPLPHLEAAPK